MTTLLNQISQGDAAARKSARATYAALLAKPEPEDGDAESLREVMATLGLTQADVANDAQVVRQVLEHEQAVAQARNADDATRREERVKLSQARVDAAQRELRAAEEEHNQAWGEIQQLSRSASIYSSEASRLRQQNPRAFGQEPPAPPTPQGARWGGMQFTPAAV